MSPPPPALGRRRIAQEFARRAIRYEGYDQDLHRFTRFFGAAALVNATLAAVLSTSRLAWAVPVRTAHWLSDMGAYLELHNVHFAAQVPRMRVRGSLLDDWLVRQEQTLVERQLGCYPLERARVLVRSLNRLIWVNAFLKELYAGPVGLTLLAQTTRVLQARHGPLTFGSFEDRLRIGCFLVALLRRRRHSMRT